MKMMTQLGMIPDMQNMQMPEGTMSGEGAKEGMKGEGDSTASMK